MNLSAFLFVWAMIPRSRKSPLFPLPRYFSLAFSMAFGGFFVEQNGFLRGPALQVDAGNAYIPLVSIFADLKTGSGANLLSGFGALTVQMDLAPQNGVCRQFPGFVKTRGPEPFVEP